MAGTFQRWTDTDKASSKAAAVELRVPTLKDTDAEAAEASKKSAAELVVEVKRFKRVSAAVEAKEQKETRLGVTPYSATLMKPAPVEVDAKEGPGGSASVAPAPPGPVGPTKWQHERQ